MNRERIFISIASYRDPQLVPTIYDCLRKASHPERLRFGICWQRLPGQEAFPFWGDPRFRVTAVHWKKSQGACWARAEAAKMWDGEEYLLQLDSHCRVVQGWDMTLVRYLRESGSEKPVVSTFGSGFVPDEQDSLINETLQVGFDKFDYSGIVLFKSLHLRPSPKLRRARFLAGGFIFTLGAFVKEVPYDPELYFIGEEISLSVRAFTNGYDLFHPCEPIVWHFYGRKGKSRHWLDHIPANEVERIWTVLDRTSRNKVRRILTGECDGIFGVGKRRTLGQYEHFAGLDFKQCEATVETREGREPNLFEETSDSVLT